MRRRTHALLIMLASLVATVTVAACSGGHGRREDRPADGVGARLSLKGSDTMVILAQRFAEGYMAAHPGTVIEVSGGGSGTGIAALLNGTTNIANASRPINDRERAQLLETRHAEAVETRVALDALAVYVHQDSAIASLTMAQLSAIFRGEITNWSGVGGPDAPIVLYSRENNSGTYAYFKEHVLDDADFAATAQTLPGTAAVINAVAHDPNGIGYGGIGYAEGVRTLPLATAEGVPAIAPTLENATSGTYPIARFLYMVTAGAPTGTAAEFLAWVVTPEGQRLVEQAGFYPLPATAPSPTEGTPSEVAPTPPLPPPS